MKIFHKFGYSQNLPGMKTKPLIRLCLLTIMACIVTGLQAQQTISASGGDATGSGGSVSYSVGQVFYHTHQATAGSVAEGVQQPFEIFVITSVDDLITDKIHLKAFPNPVITQLTLWIEEGHFSNLSYRLLDAHGQLIRSERVSGSETTVQMDFLPSGTYFLQVFDRDRMAGSFKIIKR